MLKADKDGKHLGESVARRTKWKELQAHASIAEEGLVITEGEIKTPVGKVNCWIYTVTQERPGHKLVITYHFAKKLPGPPVSLTRDLNGKRVQSVTMVANIAGKTPAAPG